MRVRKYGLAAAGVVGATLLLTATPAFAQDAGPAADSRDPRQPAVGRDRRGARHLHAGGLRARRDRLLPGEARGARRVDELRDLRPRLRRLLPRRLHVHVRRLRRGRAIGYDQPIGSALIGSGNWVFLWKGGFALGRRGAYDARRDGVLPLHGRVHGHDRDDPDRRDGRAVEVERVRRLGPVLRRDLLPAVRCVDVGRRLARQARRERAPGPRLHRLRRFRRRAHDGWRRRLWPARSSSVPASGSTARTASRGRSRRTTSRWRCSARSSCCSAGSASTPRRRSRRPTSGSPSSRRTPRSPPRSVPSSRCSG